MDLRNASRSLSAFCDRRGMINVGCPIRSVYGSASLRFTTFLNNNIEYSFLEICSSMEANSVANVENSCNYILRWQILNCIVVMDIKKIRNNILKDECMGRNILTVALSFSVFPSLISRTYCVYNFFVVVTIAPIVPSTYLSVDTNSLLIILFGMKLYSLHTGYMFSMLVLWSTTIIHSQSPWS